MTKLKLTVESLQVESFEAIEAREGNKGTVRGFDSLDDTLCDILTCAGGCDSVDRAADTT
jgi:hypothetical protein